MPADEHLFWADLAFFLICERMTVQSAYDHINNCRLSQLCSVGMILDQWRAEHIAVMGMRVSWGEEAAVVEHTGLEKVLITWGGKYYIVHIYLNASPFSNNDI